MATLTWRNVDAPDFRGSIDGVRTASDLLGRALNFAGQGGQQLVQDRSDIADRNILTRALGVQDPNEYARQLASGQIQGDDARLASLATLKALDNRAGTLINNATSGEALNQTQYGNLRTRDNNSRMDANQGILNEALVRYRSGDTAGANQLALQAGLRPEQTAAFLGTATAGGAAGNTLDKNLFEFGTQVQNKQADDAADRLFQTISRTAGTPEEATAMVDQASASGEISPSVFKRLNGLLQGAGFGYGFGPAATGGSGGGAGATISPVLSKAGGIMTGGAPLPSNFQTVGDVVDGKSDLLKANNGNTATGVYQITSDTFKEFGPKVLGQNWKSANVRDPVVQDKIAKGIWESVKDDPNGISGRWISVDTNTAQRLKGQPWENVRGLIAQRESGIDPSEVAALNLSADVTSRNINERLSQDNSTGIANNYADLVNDRRDVVDVVGDLIKPGGAFAGTSRGYLSDKIRHIVQESNGRISPAIAGAIMRDSIGGQDNLLQKLWRGPAVLGRGQISPNLPGGIKINDEDLQQRFNDYLSGATSLQSTSNNVLAANQKANDTAKALYNAAALQYQTLLSQSQSRPGLKDSVARAKLRMEDAQKALENSVRSTQSNVSLTPDFDRPRN